jgi:hypothetical protein
LSIAQSVLDLVEVDLRFTLRGFAEEGGADFMLGLRMNDGHRGTCQQTGRDEPLLPIAETIIFEGEGGAFEHARSIDEVDPVGLEVGGTFGF